MTREFNTDDYLFQCELDHERMQEWADAHSCGNCEEFFADGPFKDGSGICLRRSGMFKGELDLYFVDEDDYHEECVSDV